MEKADLLHLRNLIKSALLSNRKRPIGEKSLFFTSFLSQARGWEPFAAEKQGIYFGGNRNH
ncbi:hypothetical protein V2J23_02150 [Geobacillus thermoleovorans]|uniref:hypothetical protein n=1 Tax=Geobacillus thermoleovorans TaxID=33941 RepID=UPI00345BFA6E